MKNVKHAVIALTATLAVCPLAQAKGTLPAESLEARLELLRQAVRAGDIIVTDDAPEAMSDDEWKKVFSKWAKSPPPSPA